jgi:uncharacterized membrane protein HdeD (DUF308 family)
MGPLAARWWTVTIRGIAAILFGVALLVSPRIGLLTLVILWGAYAFADGIFNLVLAARGAQNWGWLLFEGVVSILAGVVAFLWPAITALALLAVIAVWAIITGIAEIAAAIRLRKHIQGEWVLASSGVLSIAFGILMLLFPGAGALGLVWAIGVYAILFGGLLVGLSLRLHEWQRTSARPLPTGGTPTPA